MRICQVLCKKMFIKKKEKETTAFYALVSF